MAHEITNKDSLFYAGQTPWHGIGKKVNDVLTASEALLASGLTWQVIETPIYDNEGRLIQEYKAIVRDDTKEVLQVASKKYHPVQNAECFKIFDEVTGTGLAKYEVAGSLQGGRKVWILAKLPYDFNLANGRDEVKSYLLLTTSHDGSLAFQMYQTPVRVVCMNTLRASLEARQRDKVAYFKHTVNFRHRVGQAQYILRETCEYFRQFKEAAEAMARQEMNSLQVESFLAQLFDVEGKTRDEISTKTKNTMEEVEKLFRYGMGNSIEGVKGTRWAMFNGVTEFVDHERTTRGDDENRLSSSWYGSGAQLREKAFALLTR